MNLETKSFHLVETDEYRWKIIAKQRDSYAGFVLLNKMNDVVVIENLQLNEDYQRTDYVSEIMESVCNVVFYRMKMRKLCADLNENDILNQAFVELGFHNDSDHKSSIYREEYVLYLRKKGKTLSFEGLNSMRTVFLMVALSGIVLLGMDVIRSVSSLWTSLYAYLTGIGVAGAILSTYMSPGQIHGRKDRSNRNA